MVLVFTLFLIASSTAGYVNKFISFSLSCKCNYFMKLKCNVSTLVVHKRLILTCALMAAS
ncbi:hypothetical protein Hanom_Chr06g00556061 [Helianthus anomalus]